MIATGLDLLQQKVQRRTDDSSNSELNEIIAEIKVSVTIATETLNEILDYEKIDSGAMALEKESVRVQIFINSCVISFKILVEPIKGLYSYQHQ